MTILLLGPTWDPRMWQTGSTNLDTLHGHVIPLLSGSFLLPQRAAITPFPSATQVIPAREPGNIPEPPKAWGNPALTALLLRHLGHLSANFPQRPGRMPPQVSMGVRVLPVSPIFPSIYSHCSSTCVFLMYLHSFEAALPLDWQLLRQPKV